MTNWPNYNLVLFRMSNRLKKKNRKDAVHSEILEYHDGILNTKPYHPDIFNSANCFRPPVPGFLCTLCNMSNTASF